MLLVLHLLLATPSAAHPVMTDSAAGAHWTVIRRSTDAWKACTLDAAGSLSANPGPPRKVSDQAIDKCRTLEVALTNAILRLKDREGRQLFSPSGKDDAIRALRLEWTPHVIASVVAARARAAATSTTEVDAAKPAPAAVPPKPMSAWRRAYIAKHGRQPRDRAP